jgi:hypothetical protein
MLSMTDEHRLYTKLMDSGVISEDSNSKKVSIDEEFDNQRDKITSGVLPDGRVATLVEKLESQLNLSVANLESGVQAVIAALRATAPSLTADELLTSMLVIQQIEYDDPTIDWVPKSLPLQFDYLPIFQEVYPANVLYCWREDCEPCDEVKADIESLDTDGLIPEEIGFASVYGPSCSQELNQQFNVTAAPSTLFCIGNRVDSRIVGSFGQKAIEAELNTIHQDVFQ